MNTFHDPADSPEASMLDHPSEHFLEAYCTSCSHLVDAVCPGCRQRVEPASTTVDGANISELSRQEFYRRFILLIHQARNSKFMLGCYLIATGDAYADGVSMTEFAKEWGVTKALVSKQCRIICTYLEIPPSQYMRKEETAQKCRLTNCRPRKYEQ